MDKLANIIKNLKALDHPHAQEAIEYISNLLDISDDMYVVLVNEIGPSSAAKDYANFITQHI